MNNLKEYLIPFGGLKVGKHQFDYQLDNTFFQHFDYDEFNDASVKVTVVLEKKSTMLELDFKHKGTVNVPCDVSGEEFDMPIKGKLKLLVKFGDEFNDENEELLILPHGEFEVNVAQYIYESIVVSLPLRRIHPGIKDGSLSEVIDKLNSLAPGENKLEEHKGDIDPRWEDLKKLLTDK
ncbi:YceD family protein [Flavobacterium ardleyense]|uniref:YceD family protein n=1 Tax=Flavobacterium ardleyense TaxID=2038737 RepID=A0ABW5Z6M4_9FLAO